MPFLALPLSGVARLRSLGPATKGCGGKRACQFPSEGEHRNALSCSRHLALILAGVGAKPLELVD